MTDEQLKAKSNAILDKLEEGGFDLGDWSIEDAHNNGFIDGYQECQKEHEWHYVKDGDLPPIDEYVYIILSPNIGFPVVARRHLFKSNNKWEWDCRWGSGYQVSQNSVYAWKEIVLPKEIE